MPRASSRNAGATDDGTVKAARCVHQTHFFSRRCPKVVRRRAHVVCFGRANNIEGQPRSTTEILSVPLLPPPQVWSALSHTVRDEPAAALPLLALC